MKVIVVLIWKKLICINTIITIPSEACLVILACSNPHPRNVNKFRKKFLLSKINTFEIRASKNIEPLLKKKYLGTRS